MRIRIFASLALLSGLALGPIGCSTAHREDGDHAHSHPAGYANLELNDGRKWVVDPPMMAHIRNLQRAVTESKADSSAEHAKLASEVEQNLGQLVTNCTMKGKAHDELHKWLMPFLGLSAEYSKATDLAEQQQKFREIKQALLVFNDYFE